MTVVVMSNVQALVSLYLVNDVRRVPRGVSPEWFRGHGVLTGMTNDNRKVSLRLARIDTCLGCAKAMSAESTGDHIVARVNGGPAGVENYLPLCGNCNSSKGKLDLLEWWYKKDRSATELPCDVLCAYVRLTYGLSQRLGTLLKPAPTSLTQAVRELAALLPTSRHRTELWNRVQWVVGRQ